MAGILAESVYRYATGSYKVQLLHQIKAPPSYGENGLDKQVGRILKEKPLLLSKTAFWWMNPFQFFSLPIVLLFSMVVFIVMKIFLNQLNKKSREEKAKLDSLVAISRTPGGRRKMSITERTVVRKSFIRKYAPEVIVVKSGYLKKRATTYAFAGYQRRYFELDNRKILKYWKSIFDKNEGKEARRTFNFDDPKKSEPPILSPQDMAENATSLKIKIIFSLCDNFGEKDDENESKTVNEDINKETKEVLELEAPDLKSANAWRRAFKDALG
eukprot:g106.t1